MPLAAAARLAYRRVFGTQLDRAPSNDELDLVALALSAHLAIYGVHAPGRPIARISEPDLLAGMFCGGAARFETVHRPGVMFQLSVERCELDQTLGKLERERNEPWHV